MKRPPERHSMCRPCIPRQHRGSKWRLMWALACCLLASSLSSSVIGRDDRSKAPVLYVNVLEGTRPAQFFRLIHAAQRAVCGQYAASIAPLAVSRSVAFSALTRSTREVKSTDETHTDVELVRTVRDQLGAYGVLLSFSRVAFDNTGQSAWIIMTTGKAAHAVFLPDESVRSLTAGKAPLAETRYHEPTFVKDRYMLWLGSKRFFEEIQRTTNTGSLSHHNWGHYNFVRVQGKTHVSFVFFPYADSNVPLVLAEILPDRDARVVCVFVTRFNVLP